MQPRPAARPVRPAPPRRRRRTAGAGAAQTARFQHRGRPRCPAGADSDGITPHLRAPGRSGTSREAREEDGRARAVRRWPSREEGAQADPPLSCPRPILCPLSCPGPALHSPPFSSLSLPFAHPHHPFSGLLSILLRSPPPSSSPRARPRPSPRPLTTPRRFPFAPTRGRGLGHRLSRAAGTRITRTPALQISDPHQHVRQKRSVPHRHACALQRRVGAAHARVRAARCTAQGTRAHLRGTPLPQPLYTLALSGAGWVVRLEGSERVREETG